MSTYIVTRTSHFGDKQPCDGVRRETVQSYGYWTFRSVAEAKKKYPDKEFEKIRGGVRSDEGNRAVWVVDLETLSELEQFHASNGDIVITSWYRNHELTEIEIYDGYRE